MLSSRTEYHLETQLQPGSNPDRPAIHCATELLDAPKSLFQCLHPDISNEIWSPGCLYVVLSVFFKQSTTEEAYICCVLRDMNLSYSILENHMLQTKTN